MISVIDTSGEVAQSEYFGISAWSVSGGDEEEASATYPELLRMASNYTGNVRVTSHYTSNVRMASVYDED